MRDGFAYTFAHAFIYAHGDGHGDSNSSRISDADADSNGDTDSYFDTVTAEYSDSKTSSHSTPAAVVATCNFRAGTRDVTRGFPLFAVWRCSDASLVSPSPYPLTSRRAEREANPPNH